MKQVFRIADKAYHVIQGVAIVLLCCMITLFFAQTVLRFTVNIALSWAEELCRYLFIWSVFLESGIGISKGIHVGFDLVASRLKGKLAMFFRILVNLVVLFLGIQIIQGGYSMMLQTQNQLSASLGISMSYVYASVFVGGVILVIYCAIEIMKRLVKDE